MACSIKSVSIRQNVRVPVFQRHPVLRAPVHRNVVCNAQTKPFKPPSMAPSATELEALEQYSEIVPDTVLLQTDDIPRAATVSAGVLAGILSNPAGCQEYKFAIENALSYDGCRREAAGAARTACQLDKALVNVGAMIAPKIDGRVSTAIDPRCFSNTDEIVARAKRIVALYEEMGVSRQKIVLQIAATWPGIVAVKQLESEGIACHVKFIYSMVQAVAAMQAGASVIQLNVGRVREWYNKHPGVIRDPKGPREDSGFTSTVDPGIQFVERVYNYCKKLHSKTRVMASGIRTHDDALALAGIDYMILSHRLIQKLSEVPTTQGYNDGLSASSESDSELQRALSPERAATAEFAESELEVVSEAIFRERLTMVGEEMLKEGIANLTDSLDHVLPYFENMAIGME